MTGVHPFEVRGKYRNRQFEYEVMEVAPSSTGTMIVRLNDGSVRELTVDIQQRILENIAAAERLHRASIASKKATRVDEYESHCWKCRSHVSSQELPRCLRCGWYRRRTCGACGCGYPLRWGYARVDFAA